MAVNELPVVDAFDIPANPADFDCDDASAAFGALLETTRQLPGAHNDIPEVTADSSHHLTLNDYGSFRVDTYANNATWIVTHLLTSTLHKGSLVILYPESADRVISFSHNSAGDGHILLSDEKAFSLTVPIALQYWGSYWVEVARGVGSTIEDLTAALDTASWFIRSMLGGGNGIVAYAPQGRLSCNVFEWVPTPDMSIGVDNGAAVVDSTLVRVSGLNLPLIAPTSNPRIDSVQVDVAGVVSVLTGSESASPVAPTVSSACVKLSEVYHRVGETAIEQTDYSGSANGYIIDCRTWVNA